MALNDLAIWLNHFEYHAQHPRSVPEGLPDRLTPEEQRLIASSIATFQLGEQSGGATLERAAQRFGRAHGLPALERVVALFIREEQRHARLLLAFMQDHGIARKNHDWTDRVFRFTRRLAGFELYLNVLICAELSDPTTVTFSSTAATGITIRRLAWDPLATTKTVFVSRNPRSLTTIS